MWNFDHLVETRQQMKLFESFVDYWVSPVIKKAPAPPTIEDRELPASLSTIQRLDTTFAEPLFQLRHRLLPSGEVEIIDNKLRFLEIDHSGVFSYVQLDGSQEPWVFMDGSDVPIDTLTSYLVTFGLESLMYWAANQFSEVGECWEIPVPEICDKHNLPHSILRSGKPCVYPGNNLTVHLCNEHVLSIEDPKAEVRYMSSGKLDDRLKDAIRKEVPRWLD